MNNFSPEKDYFFTELAYFAKETMKDTIRPYVHEKCPNEK